MFLEGHIKKNSNAGKKKFSTIRSNKTFMFSNRTSGFCGIEKKTFFLQKDIPFLVSNNMLFTPSFSLAKHTQKKL